MPPKKKAVKKTAATNEKETSDVKIYRCTCCGKEVADPMKVFYKTTYSKTHDGNDKYAHICVECVKELFAYYEKQYNQEFATKVICAILDVPFYRSLFVSIQNSRDDFNFGYYIRQINGRQYQGKTFAKSLYDGELEVTKKEAEEQAEELAETNWSVDERRAKSEVIKMMGYDPFEGYVPKERRIMFVEFLGYLDDDELLSDNYKIKQIIQIINNNNQINKYDIAISRLDPRRDMSEIKDFNEAKKALVASNEKIAKENGISVKSRGDQRAGKGTLTGLMRDMRDKDIKSGEVNFYNQLQSPATRWSTDISMKSMMENIQLGDNDINDIIETQRNLLQQYQDENDELKEERRLLKVRENEHIAKITAYEKILKENGFYLENLDLGGDIDG